MPTHLLSLDALLAILRNLENSHMTGHMIEGGVASGHAKKPGSEQTDLSSSAGIIFTTSNGQETMSSLPHSSTSTERETNGQTPRLSSSLSAASGLPHSDSLPAMTLAQMRKMSKSEEVVGAAALGQGKSASGRQMGVAMCQQEGVVGDGEGVELVMPSSKELLSLRQRKKVGNYST